MPISDKIDDMLTSGDIDTDAALRLILELLLQGRNDAAMAHQRTEERLTAVEARQSANPSLVWLFRYRYKLAVPIAVMAVLAVAWLSSVVTADVIGRFAASLFGIVF